ncbi:MAG: hypothetical protein ABSA71_09785 [Desulfomonilia bacterium]|jgi:hypothetical protein
MQAPDTETLTRYGWKDKDKKNNHDLDVRMPRKMLRSAAFIKLSHTSKFVLMLFLCRRSWHKDGKRQNTKRIYDNRGLIFTYNEAENLWDINRRTFNDCIVQLIAHGFLRVEKPGGTLQGERVPTLYMLVDDWQHYGTPYFVKPEIPAKISYNDSLKRFNETRKSKLSSESHLTRQVSPTSPETTKRPV